MALLRNVIEGVAVDGRDRRGRAEHQQHLLLRRADRDLLERARLQHVAALEVLRERAAAGERERARKRQRGEGAAGAAAVIWQARSQTRHPHFRLASAEALTYAAANRLKTPIQADDFSPISPRRARPTPFRPCMARSWRRRECPAFTRTMPFPTRLTAVSTSLSCILPRCSSGSPPSRRCATLGQGLFDHFWQDMDHNLREMGVGDLAVPKRMRSLGEAFYGRAGAYRAALAEDDPRALVEAAGPQCLCRVRGAWRCAGAAGGLYAGNRAGTREPGRRRPWRRHACVSPILMRFPRLTR